MNLLHKALIGCLLLGFVTTAGLTISGIYQYENFVVRRRTSTLFHLPECPSLTKTKARFLAIVKNVAEARALELRPCLWCRPVLDEYRVLRVIDGDTIEVQFYDRVERVRLLYIDTEEYAPKWGKNSELGKAAAQFLQDFLLDTSVQLEAEYPHFRDQPDQRRLLAHVFVTDGSGERMHLNALLIAKGFASYYTKYGTSQEYHTDFKNLESEARQAQLGIWQQK